jgi:hypothetical protein
MIENINIFVPVGDRTPVIHSIAILLIGLFWLIMTKKRISWKLSGTVEL